jgi:O-methyltransferase
VKKLVRACLRRLGYDIARHHAARDPVDAFVDLSEEERGILRAARPFTMTGLDRLAAVILAVKHVVRHGVPGDLAECGVWRGGSMMAAALTLKLLGDTSRTLYLYDTFEGMAAPTGRDRSFDGHDAESLLSLEKPGTGIWCRAGLDDVRSNLFSTGYPRDKLVFVAGKVEETIPAQMPRLLSLLRLDTDWYESTRHELAHLYPLLSSGGALIIDDYGHWQGARAAVDEYLARQPVPVFLHRIDYTGRIAIKPPSAAPAP